MTELRCLICAGSAKVMGGGMIIKDCIECNGTGKRIEPEEFKIEKESVHYKEAVQKIKSLDENITDEQAEKIFNDALIKIDEPKKKRKKG